MKTIKPLFTTWQWITIVGGLCVAGASVAGFSLSTFQLKDVAEKTDSRIDQRLDRMENKIDQLILRGD